MTVSPTAAADRFELALRLADDALILGHRLSEWCGHAPMLEEDIALANLGLDLIGQARAFYTLAGEIEGRGRDEDRLAYFREAAEFRNCLLVEQPNGDFAATIARQFLFAAVQHPYFVALRASPDSGFAGIAEKAAKEMAYHVRHAGEWMIRLGDGTQESRRRIVEALDELWSYSGELFEMDGAEQRLAEAGLAPDRRALRPAFEATVARVLKEATLEVPRPRAMQSGGRSGRHSEHLGHLLALMQVLARQHPDAVW
jgi:ring-1,2-phenylacetyl-CoA epoxidase subunit PaaC